MPNYSFSKFDSCPTPENGHHFEKCNFAQPIPHTEIFKGITGLRFTKCNLVNCDLPTDAVIEGCLAIHKSFCSHDMPKIADFKTACSNNCEHVIDSDEVTIDGESLGRVYHHKNMRVE